MIVAVVALSVSNAVAFGFAWRELIGRERLIRYVVSATPAEAALLERATRRHPKKKAVAEVTVVDPLETP